MEQETSIKGLFGTPLYKTKLPENEHGFFDEAEEKVFALAKKKASPNGGNIRSIDTYVLSSPRMASLKQKVMKHVDSYFKQIYAPSSSGFAGQSNSGPITPYITQSWINYTKEKGSDSQHTHANSLFSGVLYLDADIARDSITFHAPHQHHVIHVFSKSNHEQHNGVGWNTSGRHTVPVQTGDLVLFPSHLMHSVATLETVPGGRSDRVSLAFNVFVRGRLGNGQSYTALAL